ncbi:MAG: recombination protein RecR [Candidatus Binatota bacterium]|jgi:recombination protein RecR|nr:recombination protein RecR [Candidatus Binatota bacterium]
MALPAPLRRLVDELTRLPGIGEKTATRLAFFVLRSDGDYARALAEAIATVKEQIRLCAGCLGFTEKERCTICDDGARSEEIVCVVEDPADVMAVERAGDFRGRYHVLHGRLAPLDGIGPEHLKIAELLDRIRAGVVKELIVATNPTVEGEATALYLARLIKPLGIRVTRIAHGLPMGGDVEYADGVTLSRALEGRREM